MTDSIRVLVVIDSLGVGGAQALLPTFLRHVDRSRFDIRILALDATPANHIQTDVREAGVELIQWQGRRLFSVGRIREIARAIEERDVDIVHSHLLYSNVQASIAAKLTGRPVVATLHNVHRLNAFRKRTVEAGVLRLTRTRSIAVSDGVRRSYCGPLRLTEDQTTVVPNAIDLTRVSRITPEARQRARLDALDGAKGPLIVAVGRIVPQKGFTVLARAATMLHERFPDARIAIAGRAADGLPRLAGEIRQRGLSDVVRLLGQRGDVIELLAAADVFVSPSLSEGAPVTHLEAMAAGAPVVATSVGGVPEIIRHEDNGLLVPAGEAEPLARALIRLLSDPEDARRLAARGLETVHEFGADTWARRIEYEYLRALRARPRTSMARVAR